MTPLLVVLALVLATGLAWWLVPWRKVASAVGVSKGAITAVPPGTRGVPGDLCTDVAWPANLVKPIAVRKAGDWYDPTKLQVPQTFNAAGFITSPLPAPVNAKTGAVPMTNADICAWAGHVPGPTALSPCPRCGALLNA